MFMRFSPSPGFALLLLLVISGFTGVALFWLIGSFAEEYKTQLNRQQKHEYRLYSNFARDYTIGKLTQATASDDCSTSTRWNSEGKRQLYSQITGQLTRELAPINCTLPTDCISPPPSKKKAQSNMPKVSIMRTSSLPIMPAHKSGKPPSKISPTGTRRVKSGSNTLEIPCSL